MNYYYNVILCIFHITFNLYLFGWFFFITKISIKCSNLLGRKNLVLSFTQPVTWIENVIALYFYFDDFHFEFIESSCNCLVWIHHKKVAHDLCKRNRNIWYYDENVCNYHYDNKCLRLKCTFEEDQIILIVDICSLSPHFDKIL